MPCPPHDTVPVNSFKSVRGATFKTMWEKLGTVLNRNSKIEGCRKSCPVTLDTIISRFNDEGNEASGETRDVMNHAAYAMLMDKPLGVGWNNFGKAIDHPYPYGDVIDEWNRNRGQKVDEDYAKGVVESHYWLLLGETGYQGLITYILFIGVVQFRLLIVMLGNRGRLVGAVASGIFVAFLLTYLHSHLERVLTQTKNLALWMTLIGVVGALSPLIREKIRAENPAVTQG